MSNWRYKRGADLTNEMLDDFHQYLTPDGYKYLVERAEKETAEFGAVTCVASLVNPNTGYIIQKQYYLGGDESCPPFELNACMCGVDSL